MQLCDKDWAPSRNYRVKPSSQANISTLETNPPTHHTPQWRRHPRHHQQQQLLPQQQWHQQPRRNQTKLQPCPSPASFHHNHRRSPPPLPLPLAQAHALFSSFTTFLTIAVHTILFYRQLYPPRTFLAARAFNLPVRQNRHPKVCAWVRDAVAAVAAQLAAGAAERVVIALHAPPPAPPTVLERWVFDVASFPRAWPGALEALERRAAAAVDAGDGDDDLVEDDENDDNDDNDDAMPNGGGSGDAAAAAAAVAAVNWPDVDEQLRGALRRLAHAGEKMPPLPDGCTFTVVVELREEAQAPIGHPQPWIPIEPRSNGKPGGGNDEAARAATTFPVRSVEAGPLFFECWVETSQT